jgi:hypothetical protein
MKKVGLGQEKKRSYSFYPTLVVSSKTWICFYYTIDYQMFIVRGEILGFDDYQ